LLKTKPYLGAKSEKITDEPKGLTVARKTIRDAVKPLRKELAELIIRAFNATKVMDLYDGNISQYFQVIAQTLEKQRKEIDTMKNAATTIEGIIKANFFADYENCRCQNKTMGA
jgi:hypothetical protein